MLFFLLYRYKCVICSAGFILLSELCQHINMRHSLHSGPSEQENTNSTKFRPDACLPFNMWQVVRQSSIDVTVSKLLDVRFTPGDEVTVTCISVCEGEREVGMLQALLLWKLWSLQDDTNMTAVTFQIFTCTPMNGGSIFFVNNFFTFPCRIHTEYWTFGRVFEKR